MSGNISIKQKLEVAHSADEREKIIADWISVWQREQNMLVKRLGKAIANDDFSDAAIAIGELKAVTRKRFIGLRSAIDVCLDTNIKKIIKNSL